MPPKINDYNPFYNHYDDFIPYRIDLRTHEQKLKDAEAALKTAEDRVKASTDARNAAALEVVRARAAVEATERTDIIKSLHAGLDNELKPLTIEELRALKAAHLAAVARK